MSTGQTLIPDVRRLSGRRCLDSSDHRLQFYAPVSRHECGWWDAVARLLMHGGARRNPERLVWECGSCGCP